MLCLSLHASILGNVEVKWAMAKRVMVLSPWQLMGCFVVISLSLIFHSNAFQVEKIFYFYIIKGMSITLNDLSSNWSCLLVEWWKHNEGQFHSISLKEAVILIVCVCAIKERKLNYIKTHFLLSTLLPLFLYLVTCYNFLSTKTLCLLKNIKSPTTFSRIYSNNSLHLFSLSFSFFLNRAQENNNKIPIGSSQAK